MADALLVIDQGGHASRAALIDSAGRIGALAEMAIATRHPAPGWVEHDAEAVLASVVGALDQLASQTSGWPPPIAAALCCQRASVLAWDRVDGRPLTPVLSWQDTRAATDLAALELDVDAVAVCTGVRPNAHFGASKLSWLLRHDAAVAAARRAGRLRLGPLGAFLQERLSGRPGCPASLAQRTLLYAIDRGDWSPALLQAFAIDSEWLPPLRADRADHGSLNWAGRELPLRLSAGDQNLVPWAFAPLPADAGVLNLGTGGFLFVAPARPPKPSLPLLRSVVPESRLAGSVWLEATVNGAGAAFEWLRREHALAALDWTALADPRPAAVYFRNSVGGVGSPWWRAPAPAPGFSTPPADESEALRAVAISLVALLAGNLEVLSAAGMAPARLAVGGGLSRSLPLLQLLADGLGLPLQPWPQHELSLLGAWACCGGRVTAGSVAAIEPGPRSPQRRAEVAAALAWLNQQLAA